MSYIQRGHTRQYSSEPNSGGFRLTVVKRRHTARLLLTTLSMISCGTPGSTDRSGGTGSMGTSAAAVEVDVQRWIAELAAFEPNPSLSGQECGDLSISNGTVQLDATGSTLTRAIQTETPVLPTALHLTVHLGAGFPSFTCTDLADSVRLAFVEASWPASAAGATFTVVSGERCSIATLQLVGVVAVAPTGQSLSLGDITITNSAWQWWHPFECQLLDVAQEG